jgi:hypothetical protein
MLMIKDLSFREHKEGEQVWLEAKNLKTTHPTHKLRAKRYGPFRITRVLSHVAYQLELPKNWKIHNVFHASYLSPYKETTEHGPNFLEPPPDVVEGQPEWEVEAIVGRRFFGRNKQQQYRIHWKGYSNAHDSWEPEANIHAPELIAQYLAEQPTSIRTTRMCYNKNSTHRSSQLLTPGRQPLTSLVTDPATPISATASEQELLNIYHTYTVEAVTSRLESGPLSPIAAAQHEEIPVEEEQKAKPTTIATPKEQPLGAQTLHDHDHQHDPV